MRPSKNSSDRLLSTSCTQLTDRRIYFTWGDSRRRQDIPLFEDAENDQEAPPPTTSYSDVLEPAILGHWIGGYPFIKLVPLSVGSDTCAFICGKAGLRAIPWVALTLL